MRTITIELFKFEELSKEAQAVAIENNRGVFTEYQDWYEDVYEDFKENHKEFEIDKIYFSGFHSQGDGAMFEYSDISDELFCEAIDSLKISDWKKRFLKINCTIYARGKHSGHYYHEKCCNHVLEVENQFRSDYPNIEEFIDESEISIIEFIINKYETLARKLYKQLEEDYNSRMTDEYISESIIANELEFHADGKDA